MTDVSNGMRRLKGMVLAKDVDYRRTAVFALGGFVALSVVSFLALDLGQPLLVPSFGATAIILFAMPGSRAARPRSVLLGQVLSAVVGLVVSHVLGCTWFSISLGVMLAMVVMVATDTLHPPGGATVISVITTAAPWSFALAPVAVGAIVLVAVGVATERLCSRRPAA